jgi:hypothetical protein
LNTDYCRHQPHSSSSCCTLCLEWTRLTVSSHWMIGTSYFNECFRNFYSGINFLSKLLCLDIFLFFAIFACQISSFYDSYVDLFQHYLHFIDFKQDFDFFECIIILINEFFGFHQSNTHRSNHFWNHEPASDKFFFDFISPILN